MNTYFRDNSSSIYTRSKTALFSILVIALSIPISVISTQKTQVITPRAYDKVLNISNPVDSIDNDRPEITTNELKSGEVGKNYSSFIRGVDLDITNQLTMLISNLPAGLSQGKCNYGEMDNKKVVSCEIQGSPTKAGTYNVTVNLTDDTPSGTSKNLTLVIQ